MGAVHFSLDDRLVRALQNVLPLHTLVETGTFQGDTIDKMLPHFREIHTVEWSRELYVQAVARFRDHRHVHCANDTSSTWLKNLRHSLEGKSVLYWLDAHWCNASGTAGQDSQCPLLDELAAITPLNETSVVVIDDARLFLSTPPGLHKCDQWPRLRPLMEALLRLGAGHDLTVVNDLIVFSPAAARQAIAAYCQEFAWDWLAMANMKREFIAATTQFTALWEAHQKLLAAVRAKNHQIAQLHAHCNELRRPTHVIKALWRRLARLLGAPAPAAPSDESSRRAA